MKHFIVLFIITLFLNCTSHGQESTPQAQIKKIDSTAMISDSAAQALRKQKEDLAKKMSTAQITYFIIKAPDEKFGYTIFIDGQMYIEQKSIPAIQGNKGFDTKEDAEKIAKLVIEKIKHGEMPPAISVEELKGHGVIRQ